MAFQRVFETLQFRQVFNTKVASLFNKLQEGRQVLKNDRYLNQEKHLILQETSTKLKMCDSLGINIS